jgi:hypothetical protein
VIRVFVLYDSVPDPERYARHVELCNRVPAQAFRHGQVTRTLFGQPVAYYAEFEFADQDSFRAASASDEFKATGADAAEMGIPHAVHVAEVD